MVKNGELKEEEGGVLRIVHTGSIDERSITEKKKGFWTQKKKGPGKN